jgi:LysM repeat protein
MIGVSSRRMNTRRLIGYLLLNALVSAMVTLSVLWFWDRTHTSPRDNPFPILTPSNTTAANETPGNNATAPSAATVEPTLAPAPTQTTYTVQPGDTLGVIAQRYELAVEDIMAANGLTDPNTLALGQVLIIPVAGSPAASPTEVPPPTSAPPLATATPDPNQPLPQLSIREVRSPGVVSSETVVLVNAGGPVNLAGWVIRDETGQQYIFPALTLFAGGAVNLHTGAGTDTVTDLYWNQFEAVWTTGKVVQVLDTGGTVQARFTVP